MRRLEKPKIGFEAVLIECLKGVRNGDLKARYSEAFSRTDVRRIEEFFIRVAEQAGLWRLPKASNRRGNALVYRNLTRQDMIKLYNEYLVSKKKAARRIYNELIVNGGDGCSLCGGAGYVSTLDHYLPKSIFPWYSVMPSNLIPCCSDCNKKKGTAFVAESSEQTLHPYFDKGIFFSEQWLFARVVKTDPPSLDYYVSPPGEWSVRDKKRVEVHFQTYHLAKVFRYRAACLLPEIIRNRQTISKHLSSQGFSESLWEMSGNVDSSVNHWRKAMYAALAEDSWFCDNSLNLQV